MKEHLEETRKFCQAPSNQYLKMLENCGDDPRSVAGRYATNKAGDSAERGWIPTYDARDSRTNGFRKLKKRCTNVNKFVILALFC